MVTTKPVIALGVVIVAIAIWTVVAYGFRQTESARPIGIALICYGLLFAGVTTTGRVLYGISYSANSRYTTFDLLILVGCYLALFPGRGRVGQELRGGSIESRSQAPEAVDSQHRPAIPAMVKRFFEWPLLSVRVLVVIAITLVVTLGTRNGLSEAANWNQTLVDAAKVTVNIDQAPDNLVLGVLFPTTTVGFVRSMARVAKADDLSIFASGAATRYKQEGLPHESLTIRMAAPSNGAVLKGDVWLAAEAAGNVGPVTVNVAALKYEVTGPGVGPLTVGPAASTYLGWIARWDTKTVPDGRYRIRSVAVGLAGPGYSPSIFVTVDN